MKKITLSLVLITLTALLFSQVPGTLISQTGTHDVGGHAIHIKSANDGKSQKTDSFGNPIVNEIPGLPAWAEKDIIALKTEIQKIIESRETLKQNNAGTEVIHEIEYALGNFIGQALIRKINIDDILDIYDKDVINGVVSASVLEYIHYYENEKYISLLMSKNIYNPTNYSQTAQDFIYHYGGNPDELLKIETGIPESTPSGEYTMYFSYLGMTLLSGATTIWSGIFPWNNLSSDKPIGFDFSFYRGDNPEPNDSVRVSTNGYLTMFQKGLGALDGTDASNDQITSVVDPDGYLAPWWDDLIIKTQGTQDKVSYKTEGSVGSRVFTIEYYSVTRNGGDIDDYHYFQVKLNENSNLINFHYGTWYSDSQDNATIGIEDYFGYDGDCSFNCTNTNSTKPTYNVNYMTSTPGYWTGEISTDWLDASNWDDNNVPDGNTEVVIPTGCPNYPIINGPLYINSLAVNTYECNSCRIYSGATATTTGVSSSVINRGELVVDGQLDIGNDLDLANGSVTTLTGTIHTGLYTGQYGISNHYDGSVFNQEGGNLFIEGIIVDTLATFNGNSGAVRIYVDGYTLPLQEVYLYNGDVYFNSFYIYPGVSAGIKRNLQVNGLTRLEGALDILGSLSTHSLALWSGGEIIINPLCSVTANSASFYNGSALVMYSTGPPLPFTSHLYCATNIGFDSGSSTNCTSGAWINVGGYLDDEDGSFFGNVKFTGNSNSYILGYPSFRSLSIDKTGSTVYYSSDDVISVSDYVYIHSGSFNPNGYTVEVDGSWLNNVGDSGFEEGTGTVIFTTGDDISYVSDETFYDLIINGTTEVNSGGNINIIHNLDINQGLTINENSTILIGNSLEVNSGGLLDLNGTNDNEVLCSHTSGYYNFNVYTGGEISANFTIFEYMSTNGINIHNGAIMTNSCFENCTFRNGISSGSLLTINNNQDITIQEAIFPENTWGGLYNVSKTISQGVVTFEDYSGNYTGESYENDQYDRIIWGSTIFGFNLDITVFLEGPFNNPDMGVDLNSAEILPLSHPYSGLPWNYSGTESVASIPNGDVVDWVLIEIRDAIDAASATPSTIFDQQAAFLLNNGKIVGLDGSSILYFNGFIIDNLYIVIRHRNHLAIMSASALNEIGGIYSRDFTTTETSVYGGFLGYKHLSAGKYGMIAGDGDANGVINPDDKTIIWESQAGHFNYLHADYKLNGQVENIDKNDFWRVNYGKVSQVP